VSCHIRSIEEEDRAEGLGVRMDSEREVVLRNSLGTDFGLLGSEKGVSVEGR